MGPLGYEPLPNHCASAMCNFCRTRRERAMDAIRRADAVKAGAETFDYWDRPLYAGRDPRDILSYWGNSDAPPLPGRVLRRLKESPRTPGHRLIRARRML